MAELTEALFTVEEQRQEIGRLRAELRGARLAVAEIAARSRGKLASMGRDLEKQLRKAVQDSINRAGQPKGSL